MKLWVQKIWFNNPSVQPSAFQHANWKHRYCNPLHSCHQPLQQHLQMSLCRLTFFIPNRTPMTNSQQSMPVLWIKWSSHPRLSSSSSSTSGQCHSTFLDCFHLEMHHSISDYFSMFHYSSGPYRLRLSQECHLKGTSQTCPDHKP